MGVLITRKTPLFRQGNRISKNPIYPLNLKDLTVINHIEMDYMEEKQLNLEQF